MRRLCDLSSSVRLLAMASAAVGKHLPQVVADAANRR